MSRFSGFKSSNKKVKNATKTTVDGVGMDSKLEAYMYGLLKRHKIHFSMKEKIVLQDKFRYNGEAVMEIAIIPDFIIRMNGKVWICDTKGFQTKDNKIKVKMLKRWLSQVDQPPSEIHLPSNKQECEKVIAILLKELSK